MNRNLVENISCSSEAFETVGVEKAELSDSLISKTGISISLHIHT